MATETDAPGQLASRRVGRTFGLLVAAPLGLVALDAVLADHLPGAVVSVLELPYVFLVYLPATAVGQFVYEPLGVGDSLSGVPLGPQLLLLAALVGFYYLLTVASVNAVTLVRRAFAE